MESRALKASTKPTTVCNPVPFVTWACLWLVGASFALVLFAKDLISIGLDHSIGRDFTNLWTAGKLALDGRGDWAFDVHTFRLGLVEYLHMPSLQNYSYPPHALFIAAPFALLPYYVSFALWSVLSGVFFAWAAKPYLPKGFPPILAALTPAGCINLWNGHYGLLLGGLWLLFFRLKDTRPISAGTVAALLTIKPHLGLAIAFTALSRRKVLVAAGVWAVVFILASAFVFGPHTWGQFLFGTSSVQSEILNREGSDFYFRMMPSAYVTWGRGATGAAVQIAVAAAAVALLWRFRRWDAYIAATVTFLIMPYVFNYDLTVVCLGAVILLYERWNELGTPERLTLGTAFMAPNLTFVPYVSAMIPLVLLGTLGIQLRMSRATLENGRYVEPAHP
jgi:alpha-1,2-mannosyltransferase